MKDAPKTGLVDNIWLLIASLRTTAILATLMALLTGVAAVIPQGREAIELLRFEHTESLRALYTWGLTDIFASPWIRVLGVLLLTNIAAVLIQSFMRRQGTTNMVKMPGRAPHEAELSSSTPERSVEMMRESFRASLGTSPTAEKVDGAEVTMVFDSSPNADLAPLLTHIGLILLVVGAGLASVPVPERHTVVRAILKITNSQTGTSGLFDMAQDEPRKLFSWRPNFTIRQYVASRNGLGPAIRIERTLPDAQQRTDFWIYRDAPPGFDARHREGLVHIEVERMGLEAIPGKGMASKPTAVLMVFGLALLVLGALASSRAAGRIWIHVDGDRIRLAGVPNYAGDVAFGRFFSRLELLSRAILAD